ncbi:MAG: serine/threonine-protein kinase [Isosphaeraceae bacterium]
MNPVDPTRQERIDAALADYMERVDRGEAVDRNQFLAEHSEIAQELREYFDDSDQVEELAELGSAHQLRAARSDNPGLPFVQLVDEPDPSARRVHYFGDYLILGEISRGGMGVVFRARQESLQRLVALKMILAGQFATPEDVQRFHMEAQAVASLDHPHIVPIYEIGEHREHHYFSMKLMVGGSLTDQIDRWINDPRSAAALVQKVARAVQFAHERGILHRDLKPANVLLDEHGEPQVVDFGLAKKIDGDSALTQTRDLMGTPAYMAPEQTGGRTTEVTTQTDVYGIGAILYGLLAGQAPFEGATLLSTLEKVRDQTPVAPSRKNPKVPSPLDLICLRCLEKDPARRYATTRDVADELERWLEGRPILARPVGSLERFWMWCQREPAKAGLSCALVAALGVGILGVLAQWREAVYHRAAAETERNQKEIERRSAVLARGEAERSAALALAQATAAQTTLRFLADDVLGQADPEQNPIEKKLTVEEALDRAAARIDATFQDQPDVFAALADTIGWSYHQLGRFDKAEPLIQAAYDTRKRQMGETHPLTLSSADHLASTLARRGRTSDAERLRRELVAQRTRIEGQESIQTISARNSLAILLKNQGKLEESETIYREILPTCERMYGPAHAETLSAMSNFASLLASRGLNQEAESYFRRVLDTREQSLGPSHPDTLTSRNNLGIHLQVCRKPAEAERLLRSTLEGRVKVYGPEHVKTVTTMNNLAQVLTEGSRLEESEKLHREALRIRRRDLGAEHPLTLSSLNNLALVLHRRRQRPEPETLLQEVLTVRRRRLGSDHPDSLGAASNLGAVLVYWGEHERALPLLRECYEAGRRARGDLAASTTQVLVNLAPTLLQTGRVSEAESAYRKLFQLQERGQGPIHTKTLSAMKGLAESCLERGKIDEASRILKDALTRADQLQGSAVSTAALDLSGLRTSYAEAQVRLGAFDQAEDVIRQWRESRNQRSPSTTGRPSSRRDELAEMDCMRGACLVAHREYAQAEPMLQKALLALKTRDNTEVKRRRILALDALAQLHESTGRHQEAEHDRLLKADEQMPARPFADPPSSP